MDVVPRRLDHIVPTGTEGAIFDWSVSEQVAEEAAGEVGDRCGRSSSPATCSSSTSSSCTRPPPSRTMQKSRWAIESWFFGASASPAEYSPLAAVAAGPDPSASSSSTCRRPAASRSTCGCSDEFGEAGVYPDATDGDAVDVSPQLLVPVLLERWAERRDQIRVVAGHFPLCTIELLDADFSDLHDPAGSGRADAELPASPPRAQSHDWNLTLEEIYEDPRPGTSGTSSRTTW